MNVPPLDPVVVPGRIKKVTCAAHGWNQWFDTANRTATLQCPMCASAKGPKEEWEKDDETQGPLPSSR